MSKPWKLNIGCHRGDVMSRDSICDEYESLERCRGAYEAAKKHWREWGYHVWYAKAYGPDGEEIVLDRGRRTQ